MTNTTVPQNGTFENDQPEEIIYIVHFTQQAWLDHWQMLAIGQGMAEGLAFFPPFPPVKFNLLALIAAVKLMISMYNEQRVHLQQLAKRWFEITKPLHQVYDKAIKVGRGATSKK